MEHVVINGKRVKYSDCWDNTTTRQYQRIVSWDADKALIDRDYFKLFGIISDTYYKSFQNTTENKATLWQIVSWVIDDPFPKFEVPKLLKIRGKYISVPRETRLLSIGQNIHARQELDKAIVLRNKESGKFVDCDCYSIIVAIFIQPLVDGGEFDFDKAKELEKEIAEMPITLIKPIGFFLLKHVLNRGKSSIWTWLKTRISPIKKERTLLLN